MAYSQQRVETGDVDFEFKKTETFDKTSLSEILSLPREKYFNRLNLADDLQRLNKFYFDNGFFDALIDTATSYDSDDKEMNVKFIIIENTRYLLRELIVEGLENVKESAKNEISQNQLIQPGEPYVRTRIIAERDRILNVLLDNGYYYAQMDTSRSVRDSSRMGIIIGKYSEKLQENPEFKDKVLVKLSFIGTDDIYTFGETQINIEKNKYNLGKDIIERELKFKKGDVYSKSKMLESERNFTKLSIIQLGRVVDDTVIRETKTVNINVNITLSNKYELTPSIAAVYQNNIFFGGAGLEYKDKDFFGGGRVFTIKPEVLYNSPNSNIAAIELSLYQPFLFRSNITATLTSSVGLLNLNELLEFILLQNLLRLDYYIADFTFYNNAYSDLTYDYVRLRAKQDFIDDEGNLISANTKSYSVNTILGLTLVHNNTNNIFNPSHGFYHSITAESAGGLARLLSIFNKDINYSQYIKLYTPNSVYFDLSGGRANSIFASHVEIGDIIEYGSGENIQPVRELYKFFCGGGNSVRGWKAQSLGMVDNPSLGGKFLLEGSFEFRRKPFPQRSFLYPVWTVLFLDWGNVWEKEKYFRMDQIALATGFGIRYDTFVGPVRIDVGFKLFDPKASEGKKWLWQDPKQIFISKYAIQFGLGNAF
jgi:outer membrane protein insertion porin family